MFTVTNVRLGFATNSSSAHSIILTQGAPTSTPLKFISDDPETLSFGWENEKYSDAATKLAYVAAATYQSLRHARLAEWQVATCMRELFAQTPIAGTIADISKRGFDSLCIDHQSAWSMPNPLSPNFPAMVNSAIDFFLDERVSVQCGNDNAYDEEDDEPLFKTPADGVVLFPSEYGTTRFKRDGAALIVYNTHNGAKIRLASADGTYNKASTPELVDLKITDACPFKCSFCYQSSLPQGKEPNYYGNILPVIQALGIKGLGVFEVALGGGEPTSYPKFAQVLEECANNFVTPNFTTFAVDWLLDQRILDAVNMYAGGIGVSVHEPKQVKKAIRIKEKCPTKHVMVQHVLGTLNAADTLQLIFETRSAKLPLLLLGYKSVGFGKSGTPHPMALLLEEFKRTPYAFTNLTLAVDTALVTNHPELMEFFDANKILVTSEEGKFSMYIDAVENFMASSSYTDESRKPYTIQRATSTHVPTVSALAEEIKSTFAAW